MPLLTHVILPFCTNELVEKAIFCVKSFLSLKRISESVNFKIEKNYTIQRLGLTPNISGKVTLHFLHPQKRLLGNCCIRKNSSRVAFRLCFFCSQEGILNISYNKLSSSLFCNCVSTQGANVNLFCEKSSTSRINAFFTGQFKHSQQHGNRG